MREERAARIRGLVDRLPPEEAQVVRLRHLEGKTLADISAIISRSPDGTAGLLKRAMKRLKEMMQGEEESV
jgi:RNA polymerase sigma factor (sigma-70 family)